MHRGKPGPSNCPPLLPGRHQSPRLRHGPPLLHHCPSPHPPASPPHMQNFSTFLNCLDPSTANPSVCSWTCVSDAAGLCKWCNGLDKNVNVNVNGNAWPAVGFCVADDNNGTSSLGAPCSSAGRTAGCSGCIYFGQGQATGVNTYGVCGDDRVHDIFAGKIGQQGLIGIAAASLFMAFVCVIWMVRLCKRCCCPPKEQDFANNMAAAYDAATGQQVYLLKTDAAGYVAPLPQHVNTANAPKF